MTSRAGQQDPSPEQTEGDLGDPMLQIQGSGLQTRASGSYSVSVSPRSEQASSTLAVLNGAHEIEGPSVATSANGFDL